MFLLNALVHNDCGSNLYGLLGGLIVDDAQLHPYDVYPFTDSLLYDCRDPGGVGK
jgi:hypothetical protein